ncbi:MAG: uracil phosphoribosyltransferase, partial [Verrucomicrobiaceae bacterium]
MSTTSLAGVTVIDHPLVRVKLTQLRAASTTPAEFRRQLTELATLMAFEVTRTLGTSPRTVQTPLAPHEGSTLAKPVVLAPILRAGLGMLEGMLQVLSDASVAHIGIFRNEETHLPQSYYFKAPTHLGDAEVIVADPMLATGGSACAAIATLKQGGARAIRYVCLVSCPQGIERLREMHPDVPIFTAAIDPELSPEAY